MNGLSKKLIIALMLGMPAMTTCGFWNKVVGTVSPAPKNVTMPKDCHGCALKADNTVECKCNDKTVRTSRAVKDNDTLVLENDKLNIK
jgi:hypothetical protein